MKNFNYEFHPFYPQDLKREGAQKLARAVLRTIAEDQETQLKKMKESWEEVANYFFDASPTSKSKMINAYLNFYYAERQFDFLEKSKNQDNKMIDFFKQLAQ